MTDKQLDELATHYTVWRTRFRAAGDVGATKTDSEPSRGQGKRVDEQTARRFLGGQGGNRIIRNVVM